MTTYELYEIDGGWGYRVLVDGSAVVDQPFKPEVQGFVRMTEAEAEALAQAEVAQRTAAE